MKFTSYILLFLGLVCISSGSPSNLEENGLPLRQGKLIEDLLHNLQQSAKQAVDATVSFSQGLQDQAKLFSENLLNSMKGLRKRITAAINKATDTFTDAGSAVRVCIESQRVAADDLFSDTVVKAKSCADQRIKDVQDMVRNLLSLSDDAMDFSNNALEELKNCTEHHSGNIFTTSACLAAVTVKSEIKGTLFLSKIGLSITRINLAISSLPATLQVCAASQLVSAGIGTTKLVMEIGGCSASSAFSSISGIDLEF